MTNRTPPDWACEKTGYGNGDGYGDSYGNGNGDGDGYGDGSGYSDGYGWEEGDDGEPELIENKTDD